MATFGRHLIIPLLRCFTFFWCFRLAYASPVVLPFLSNTLITRSAPIISNATGHPVVFNPNTQQQIPQSPASDGAGKNFSPPAILWIGFCSLVGPPLAIAGVRGWRITTGVGIGLSAAVCCTSPVITYPSDILTRLIAWAAFISSVSSVGISDIFLTLIVLAFFTAGFVVGCFEIGRIPGIILLSIIGGLAFGIRVVIILKGLLISQPGLFFLNWLIVTAFAVAAGLQLLRSQRAGIVSRQATVTLLN